LGGKSENSDGKIVCQRGVGGDGGEYSVCFRLLVKRYHRPGRESDERKQDGENPKSNTGRTFAGIGAGREFVG
jgi:hypothetical protein